MTPQQYQDAVHLAINNELSELQLRYDTRALAALMMFRSVYLLRALVAAGKWTEADIQTIAMEALADLHTPLDNKPRVIEKNDPDPLA